MNIPEAIKTLKSNSGYNRDTDSWIAQRTLVEFAENPRIWMLQYNSYYEPYDYRGYWETKPDEDFGIFLTQEAAQEKADSLNNYQGLYEKFVEATRIANLRAEEDYQKRRTAWKALVASGIENPEKYMPKPRLDTKPILTFEEWVRETAGSRGSFYDVIEIGVKK